MANLKMRLKGLKLMTLLSDSFNKTASPVLEPSKTVPKPVLIYYQTLKEQNDSTM